MYHSERFSACRIVKHVVSTLILDPGGCHENICQKESISVFAKELVNGVFNVA